MVLLRARLKRTIDDGLLDTFAPLQRQNSVRNMSPNTHKIYTYDVANFSAFVTLSGQARVEDVRDYHLHLVSRNLKPTTINEFRKRVVSFGSGLVGFPRKLVFAKFANIQDIVNSSEGLPLALCANDDGTKTCREFTLEGIGQTSSGYAPNQKQQDH